MTYLVIHTLKLFCKSNIDEHGHKTTRSVHYFYENDFFEMLFFSISLLCLIFRGMEHLGQFATFTGPYIRAFEKIFEVIVIFILLIIIISLGCTFCLANFLCVRPTVSDFAHWNNSFCGENCYFDRVDNSGSSFYKQFVISGQHAKVKHGKITTHLDMFKFCQVATSNIEQISDNEKLFDYRECSSRIFMHFMVQPFGCTISKNCEYPYFVDQKFDRSFLKCYSKNVEILMNYVHMFYFTTIIVALMRGVLIKYLMGSKIEEETTIIVHKTEIYIQNTFRDLDRDHPVPWNLVLMAIRSAQCAIERVVTGLSGMIGRSNGSRISSYEDVI